jgi:TRAP-type C4-dicarboxylate transport system permease small subunit
MIATTLETNIFSDCIINHFSSFMCYFCYIYFSQLSRKSAAMRGVVLPYM